MSDQKSEVVEEKAVESETIQTSSPQVEETITESQTTSEESDDQGSAVEESDKLPESEEERRRAFQEMRRELKQLKAERAPRERSESAFDAFRQTTPPVSQPGQIRVENYQDPLTGETNWSAYNQAVQSAIQQTATYTAQQTTQEIIDENNARNKHPELFSDPEVEQEIADRWIAAKLRGENATVSDIADRVAKRFSKAVSKAEKIGAEKVLNEVSEKEKAALSAESQTSEPARQAASAAELSELSSRTRVGDDDAITARISKIPWANK